MQRRESMYRSVLRRMRLLSAVEVCQCKLQTHVMSRMYLQSIGELLIGQGRGLLPSLWLTQRGSCQHWGRPRRRYARHCRR